MDVYLVNNGTENRLYKNNAGNTNKWVILKLRGVTSNRSAIGARVKIKTGNFLQIREVSGGSGGKGQNSLPVEFGLGPNPNIDSIIIRWPSGLVQGFANIPVNQIITAVEGQPLVGIVDPSAVPDEFKLEQNYPNPFNPATKIEFSLPLPSPAVGGINSGGAHIVRLVVYDVLGREVANLIPPLWGGKEGLKPGNYEIEWDGSGLPSGIYFYRLEAEGFSDTKKMILVK
jgi:hypothetical protein